MKKQILLLGVIFTSLLFSYTSCERQEEDLKVVLHDSVIVSYQTLPSASALIANYPEYGKHLPDSGMSDQEFADMVGGLVKLNLDAGYWGNNTCALKLSHTINLSGHPMPFMSNETSSADNGYVYVFRVKTMKEYLIQAYGEPTIVGKNKDEFIGHKGIILFETGNLWNDATGHSTVFNGDRVLGGNYAHIPGYYFNNALKVMLWEAK